MIPKYQAFAYLQKQSLFKNKKALQSNYTPKTVPYRSDQINQVASIIAPALRGDKPSNLFIYGKSGTGKTTLVKLLIAEEKPTRGNIEIGGWDITKISYRDVPLLRRQIGVIFQDFKLLPKKTVAENVEFAMQVAGESLWRIRTVVPRVLEIVGLEHKQNRYPTQLSGGEQQRVGIARAIVQGPALLVADEPTGNLDPATSMEIFQLLERINQRGTTVLVATHNQPVVDQMRKRVLGLNSGRMVSDVKTGTYISQAN